MRNRNVKWYLAKGIAAVLMLLGTQGVEARQSPASVKALGMGGTANAYARDSIAPFYNPATAVCLDERWDVGFHLKRQNKELYLYDRDVGVQTGRFSANNSWDAYGEFGINKNFCWCDREFTFGLQYNNYDHIRTRYSSALQDFAALGSSQQLKFDWRTEALTFSGAYSWNNRHHIGVGLNVYFSWLQVQGLDGLADADFTIDPGNFNNRGTDDATGVGVTLGYYGQICDDLWLGLSWTPEVSMGTFNRYRGLLAEGSLDLPETWRVGLAYQYDMCTVMAADWEYREYGSINSFGNNFPGSTATGFAPLFGANNGPGFGFDDEWTLSLGIDRALTECLTGRIGYRHEHGPSKRSAGTDAALQTLTLATVENYLSMGFTYKLNYSSELSGYAEFGLSETNKANYPDITTAGAVTQWEPAQVNFKEKNWSFGLAYGSQF